MSEYISFLITIFVRDDESLLECAVKININEAPPGFLQYYMMSNSREFFHSLLPPHIAELGPVIHIREIADVVSPTLPNQLPPVVLLD